MDCKHLAPVIGCLRREVGPAEQVIVHYEYRTNAVGNAVMHAVRVTNALGIAIVVGPNDVVDVGFCAAEQYSTEFSHHRFVGAVGTVALPVGTRSITVFNNTSATLGLTIGSDTQAVPPFSAHNISMSPDNERTFGASVSVSVLSGTVGGAEDVILNFKAVY